MGRAIVPLILLFVVALLALVVPQAALAQNADIDWADAGAPSLGTFPNGGTVTGSDGTTATVTRTIATSGASTFTPASFAGDFLSYFSGTIGNGQSPLLLNFDNSEFDPLDRVAYTITLSRAVTDLNFALSDIDASGFIDAVEVYYDDDLTGGFTNAANNTAFWSIGSAVTRTNDATLNGWRGTSSSGQFTTDGDVAFDFGATPVQRIRVVFFSFTGTGNPPLQWAGLSDLTYFAPGADLELTKSLIGSPPIQGGTATWRLTVVNNAGSNLTGTGIVVRDTFPANFIFGSASGDGSFNSANSEWTVPNLAPGDSASIAISGSISAVAGTTITNIAEIIAANEADPDSTANNGNIAEDDYAESSFTVQTGRAPGIPPVLSCPAGFSVFDWDTISGWTAGSVDNTFAFGTFGNIRFQLTNDGTYVNNATFGGQSPNVFNAFTSGLVPAEDSLTVLADQVTTAGDVDIDITLPRSFSNLQFTIFDVDFSANQFTDRVEVVGFLGAATVIPTLTNGNVNEVTGNVALGDGASNNDQALGNVVVTFTQPVDRVLVTYGNVTTGTPGQQGIGLHDITVCNPFADLTVSKISSVISDPTNGTTNPKAIPGAIVEYLITIANNGTDPTDPDSVVVWDDGPADAKLCRIDQAGGPIVFTDPGSNSGLSFSFVNIGSGTDDIEFSNNDASSFSYTPVADGDGCDEDVTDFRVLPDGALSAGGNFTLRARYILK